MERGREWQWSMLVLIYIIFVPSRVQFSFVGVEVIPFNHFFALRPFQVFLI
jgi:hypothetical protein